MITSQRVETHSFEETLKFGEHLAHSLVRGDVLAVSGELGAGKTALVKGIARGLGITQDVTSPTFTLVHEYVGGRFPLFHIDVYRLKNVEQALAIGLTDYLSANSPGVAVVEWADKLKLLLPSQTTRIRMESVDENTRRIEVE